MFAILKTGGKQYKVTKGDVISVEKLTGNEGDTIVLNDVLAYSEGEGKIALDQKALNGVGVAAEVLEQKRDKKVLVFKKKRRHNYRRKQGHRQSLTVLRVQDIGKDLKAKPAVKAAEKKANPKKVEAKDTDAKAAATTKQTAAKKPAAKKDEK